MTAPDPRVVDVLIRDLVDEFPEPRPAAEAVATVLAEAGRQRRRRRRGGALGSLVVAALMAVATLALVLATPTGPGAPVAAGPSGAAAPLPPEGAVWLRHGRAALAVPEWWREDVTCGDLGMRVTADLRRRAVDPARCFDGASGGASWVRFGSFDTAVGAAVARVAPVQYSGADGKPAESLTRPPTCTPSRGCTGIVVLALTRSFALVHGDSRAAVQAILDSLTFLPGSPGSDDAPGGS